ncbi:MAG: ComEC/Rec2 family competence protein [Chitinophagales bacterium]
MGNEIYQQIDVKSWQIKLLQADEKYALQRKSNDISIKVQTILKKYIPNKKYFQLADGILLGHKSDLDADTYQAFALSGLMHILSVSGLHVGIVYMLLSFLFSFLPKKKKYAKWIKFGCVAIGIWLFAFIVGLTPAVVRAAILFSLLNFGKLNNERSTALNLLAGACFIQLLFNPLLIYNIGFQLSYLAMLGIFLMYQPINTLFYSKYKIINWIWQLWSLSLAAQVFTLPLSIYYFGNFPTYFLLANIFAIPLATLILWLSVVLIPASLVPTIAVFIGKVNSFLIALLIKSTQLLVTLPLGKIQNIYISNFSLLLIFIAVILFVYAFKFKQLKLTILAMCIFVFCIANAYWLTYQCWKKDEFFIYSIPNNLCFAVHHQNKSTIISTDTISDNQYNFNIDNNEKYNRITTNEFIVLNDSTNLQLNEFVYSNYLINFKNKYLYILNKNNVRWKFAKPLAIDYLIVSDNLFLNIEQIKENYQFQKVIISSDNDYYHTKTYRKILEDNKVSFIDINEKYFELE